MNKWGISTHGGTSQTAEIRGLLAFYEQVRMFAELFQDKGSQSSLSTTFQFNLKSANVLAFVVLLTKCAFMVPLS